MTAMTATDALIQVEDAARTLIDQPFAAIDANIRALFEALDTLDRVRAEATATAEAALPTEYDPVDDGFAYPVDGSPPVSAGDLSGAQDVGGEG